MIKVELLKSKRNLILSILLGILVFFIPLSSALTNIMLIPAGIFFLVYYSPKEWFSNFPKPIKIFFFSIGLMWILSIFKGSFLLDINIYSRYLVVILVCLLSSKIQKEIVIENFYLSSLILVTCISTFKIVEKKMENPDLLFDNGLFIDQVLWESRPLAAFMLVLGIFICLRRISIKSKPNLLFIFLAVCLLFFCNYISARLSLMLAIILIFYFTFFKFQISKKTKLILLTSLFIGLPIMLLFNKSLIERTPFNREFEFEKIYDIARDREPRYVIWNCVAILLTNQSNFYFGISSYEQYRQDLVKCYEETIVNREEKKAYYMESRFNSHNQFLDFWLNGGLIPFLLLLLLYITVFFSKKMPSTAKLMYLLFFCFFLFENVLYRQMGCYLFGIFATLYLYRSSEKTIK
tara:strand:+ start:3669 stop:4889 length:1221 start_codon:yes stop_codon:yes gene_type:complete